MDFAGDRFDFCSHYWLPGTAMDVRMADAARQ
jgi:hypothetical protein